MKKTIENILLVAICITSVILSFNLSMKLKKSEVIINRMKVQMDDLEQKRYSDSTLLYEYQQALQLYIQENPISASEYVKFIENINLR